MQFKSGVFMQQPESHQLFRIGKNDKEKLFLSPRKSEFKIYVQVNDTLYNLRLLSVLDVDTSLHLESEITKVPEYKQCPYDSQTLTRQIDLHFQEIKINSPECV